MGGCADFLAEAGKERRPADGFQVAQGLQFLGRIDRVRNEFAEENFMVGIQELLDYRKNVLGGYTDLSFVCQILIRL